MVISDTHRFIFLRVPKNASTSLATFFVMNYCSSRDDVYTGIGDSRIQSKNIPQNVLNKYRQDYRFIHMTLNEILQNNLVSESYARKCKTIGVLRDPFDRQLSLYFFKKRRRGDPSPDEFRKMFRNGYCEDDSNNRILQSQYLKIGDQSVGEWWLYEDLNQHLAEFQREHSTGVAIDLPHYKSSFRKTFDKQKQIEYYYDDKTRNAVLDYFGDDVDLYQRLKSVRKET